jgi:hypothetical protein
MRPMQHLTPEMLAEIHAEQARRGKADVIVAQYRRGLLTVAEMTAALIALS